MDIVALSVAMHSQDILTNVGVAVLDKNLDTVEDMGTSMVKMMESSVYPNLGQNIDISV